MTVEIRPYRPDEIETFFTALSGPFSFDLHEDEAARRAWLAEQSTILEPERSRCVFDDGDVVGTLGVFSLSMTVPGATVPCAGTTHVSVQPTHRRRGLLRAMMSAHLAEARERGDVIAALHASDSAIYGRFGYGLASVDCQIAVDRNHTAFHRGAPEPTAARLVTRPEAEQAFPSLYEQVRSTRPGAFTRSPDWWRVRHFADDEEDRDGFSANRFAVSAGGGGYARFRVKRQERDGHGDDEVLVEELVASDPGSAAGLWRLVLSHDLAGRITAPRRPVDDPLFDLLAAPRRAAPRLWDGAWVRLLDVPAALTSRRYSGSGSLVVAVHDPLEIAGGRFRLTADAGSAECVATDDEPDIALDLEDLGSAYLGRSRLRALLRAGRVDGSVGAVTLADDLFDWDPPPWCPESF